MHTLRKKKKGKERTKSTQRSPTEEKRQSGPVLTAVASERHRSRVLHPHKRGEQKLVSPLMGPIAFKCTLYSLYFSMFWRLKRTRDYCSLVSSSFLRFSTFCLPLLLSSPFLPSLPLWACGDLSLGMRERGEWGRQALSWLSWEPLAPCVLGPVLPPLSINLQWQLHCLPNPPRILGDDWSAPLCSINLWPPVLRHQSQAWGLGLTRPKQPVGHLSDVRGRTPVKQRQSAHKDVSQLVSIFVTPH